MAATRKQTNAILDVAIEISPSNDTVQSFIRSVREMRLAKEEESTIIAEIANGIVDGIKKDNWPK